MNIRNVTLVILLAVMSAVISSLASAESNGTWSCTLDSKEWKNNHGGASLNGGMLTLYSGDDRLDGIYIMTGKPAAVGSYALNDTAQASLSDSAGKSHTSKPGSGALEISKFSPPAGESKGTVEGRFSGTFPAEASKEYVLKDCTFSLPVKNL